MFGIIYSGGGSLGVFHQRLKIGEDAQRVSAIIEHVVRFSHPPDDVAEPFFTWPLTVFHPDGITFVQWFEMTSAIKIETRCKERPLVTKQTSQFSIVGHNFGWEPKHDDVRDLGRP